MFGNIPGQSLAASITRASSRQTYTTIRYLVDRELVQDAYRAYGYFRWLDDELDRDRMNRKERLAFVDRQKNIMNASSLAEPLSGLALEEQMLERLIQNDPQKKRGLQSYIHYMMAVMEFDANRRGRLISRRELTDYSKHLSIAVTEALHYFIGHNSRSPRDESRYMAVTGAHIAHMLRDTYDDLRAGYFNIPREFLESHEITPYDTDTHAYRLWVENQVRRARACFDSGRDYLSRVESFGCRLAGYAYMARFEGILDVIEKDGYRLREEYSENQNLLVRIGMIASALWPARPAGLPAHETQAGEL